VRKFEVISMNWAEKRVRIIFSSRKISR
jgi:hypothetical protein